MQDPTSLVRVTTPAVALRSVGSMMITTLPRPSALLATVLAAVLVGSMAGPATAADHDVAEQIAAVVAAARSDLDVPGVTYVVVMDGEVVALGASGVADRTTQALVDPVETRFRIGSVSKPLTALSVLLAEEQELIDLAAPVDTYVDVDLGGETPVTVGSLLTHTAGFETNVIGLVAETPEGVAPLAEYVTANVPGRFAATGEVHSYSNYGYALAGRVVEAVTDATFEDHLDRVVFAPLGMDATSFAPGDMDALATPYVGVAGAKSEAVEVHLRPYPAGGAVTTADDMGELLLAMLGHRPEVVPVSVAERLATTGHRAHPELPGRTVAGLEELTINGHPAVGHNGDIEGFGAQLALVPGQDIGIFFAANTEDFELNERLLDDIVDVLAHPLPVTEPTFVELSEDELAALAGSYRWTRYSRTQVSKVLAIFPAQAFTVTAGGDGTLTLEYGAADERWTYQPVGDLVFGRTDGEPVVIDGIVVDPGDRIAFTQDDDGEVAYVHWSMATIAGERTPTLLMGASQQLLIAIVLGLLLLSLVVLGVSAWRRRRRGEQGTAPERRLRRATAVVVTLIVLGFGTAIMGLLGPVQFGLTPTVSIGIAVVTVASLLGLAAIPASIVAWRQGLLGVVERSSLTSLALATPLLVFWLTYWNLFGFQL